MLHIFKPRSLQPTFSLGTTIALGLASILIGCTSPKPGQYQESKPVNQPSLSVAFWGDRPEPMYSVGETLRLRVRVNQDAQVIIYNTDAYGKVTVLFPNAFASDNWLLANQDHWLSGLTVPNRTGITMLRAIATTGSQPLLNTWHLNHNGGPFATFRGSTTTLLHHTQAVNSQQPGALWATAAHGLKVVVGYPFSRLAY